jgi:hypothetical protein
MWLRCRNRLALGDWKYVHVEWQLWTKTGGLRRKLTTTKQVPASGSGGSHGMTEPWIDGRYFSSDDEMRIVAISSEQIVACAA